MTFNYLFIFYQNKQAGIKILYKKDKKIAGNHRMNPAYTRFWGETKSIKSIVPRPTEAQSMTWIKDLFLTHADLKTTNHTSHDNAVIYNLQNNVLDFYTFLIFSYR